MEIVGSRNLMISMAFLMAIILVQGASTAHANDVPPNLDYETCFKECMFMSGCKTLPPKESKMCTSQCKEMCRHHLRASAPSPSVGTPGSDDVRKRTVMQSALGF
ncbi:uncharacterized protein LOC116208793 [Punica granatum]|uniref:Uncharacterized protein LOC116208792 n=2 Tax=Punica granatum TaxID=22663 RepID=A0A6P8E0F8_PUNGR|nr:uncharacterized protein LOC116208792 [Punica granatum]XP_031398214.1 uncharacterized protein LOC116208793 [Punica granatum]